MITRVNPIKQINNNELSNSFTVGVLTADYDDSTAITSIAVTATSIALKDGDKFIISGVEFTVSADSAATATSISVDSITPSIPIQIGDKLQISKENLFVQYQRKTQGTIAGMPVDDDDLGPINHKGGEYTIDSNYIIGVDLDYIKILPRDFVANDDVTGSALQFVDGTNTGMVVEDPSQEMVASIAIPYGKIATEVIIYSNNSLKTVDVYEMDIDANGLGTAIGTGTLNSVVDITDTISTATNFLLIKVIVTSSNHRVWGGKVTLI
tara:strand:- start:5610 stop:6410 length:801 start_codon:yes stop_codon:yes gene_type:complete